MYQLSLSPDLWKNGKFPTLEQYRSLLKRGVLLYNLDNDSKFDNYSFDAVNIEDIVKRKGNLLYVTSINGYNRKKTRGFKGCSRNENLLPYVEQERDYMEKAHAAGIPVLVYQNENNFDLKCFSEEETKRMIAEITPFAWAFSNEDRVFACYNKPGWMDFLVERLAIRVGDTKADGIFMDNNTPFLHCRCEHCKRLYKEAFGPEADMEADMGGYPETVVADMRVFDYVGTQQVPKDLVRVENKNVMRYLEWRISRIIAFHKELRERVQRRIGREVLYTANGHVGIAEQSAVQLSGALDMIFSEDGFTAPPVSNAFNIRLGSAMTDFKDSPFVITRVVEGIPNGDMVRGLNAECRALGGQGEFWDKNYQMESHLAAAQLQYRKFFVEHAEDIYCAEKPNNDIAIIYSWRSDLWTSQSVSPAKKWACLLDDINVPYDVLIAEKDNHAELMDNYQLVIVPAAEILSDFWFNAVQKRLEQGGKVITSGDVGILNEHLGQRSTSLCGENLISLTGAPEYSYYKTRRIPSMHNGYCRPDNDMTRALERILPNPAVCLNPSVELITINRTKTDSGEIIHLVNRLMNINPATSAMVRRGLVLQYVAPACVRRMTWLSPDNGEEQELSWVRNGDSLMIKLPDLRIYALIRIEFGEPLL